MRKGDRVELDIADTNNLGCGIARCEGKVVFVKGAVTGDTVRAQVIKDNKSYCVARLEQIVKPSEHRIEQSVCDAPLSCGGCVYRHVRYDYEKQLKQEYVKNCFEREGLHNVTVLPTCQTDRTLGYRNKGQYPVSRRGGKTVYGFYASKTHDVIPCNSCAIQNPTFAPICREICSLCDKLGIGV